MCARASGSSRPQTRCCEQSLRNPDGTGLRILRTRRRAGGDRQGASGGLRRSSVRARGEAVSSTTFVSHIRYATAGERSNREHASVRDGRNALCAQRHDSRSGSARGRSRHVTCASSAETPTPSATSRSSRRRSAARLRASVPGISAAVELDRPEPSRVFDQLRARLRLTSSGPSATPRRIGSLCSSCGAGGGCTVGRDLHYVSGTLRVHIPDLHRHPSVVRGKRAAGRHPRVEAARIGRARRVGPDLSVRSSIVVELPPAQLIRLAGSTRERASVGPTRS